MSICPIPENANRRENMKKIEKKVYKPVEARSLVSESMLASAKLAEVFSSLGDDIVVELEDDSASRVAVNGDIKLNHHRSH